MNNTIVTNEEYGMGMANTIQLMTWLSNEGNLFNSSHADDKSAAKYCHFLQVANNGVVYDDWYLPTRKEVQTIWETLSNNFSAGIGTGVLFWTSGASDPASWNTAYGPGYVMGNGTSLGLGPRDLTSYCRAIRKF